MTPDNYLQNILNREAVDTTRIRRCAACSRWFNTAATPIAGTFSNLADGSTLVADGNTFQVSYEGGTGNDLTLTVVP